MEPELWLVVLALWLNAVLIWWQFAREDWPKSEPDTSPDWFWGGDSTGANLWVEVKPEPNDPEPSKPESGAG